LRLVDFITRIYHDARSPERQIGRCNCGFSVLPKKKFLGCTCALRSLQFLRPGRSIHLLFLLLLFLFLLLILILLLLLFLDLVFLVILVLVLVLLQALNLF